MSQIPSTDFQSARSRDGPKSVATERHSRIVTRESDFADVNEESHSSVFSFRNLRAGRAAHPRKDPASEINAI